MKVLVLAFVLHCALLVYADDGCPDNEEKGKGEFSCDGKLTTIKDDKNDCYCKLFYYRNIQDKCVKEKGCEGKEEETTTTEKTTTTTKPEPTQTPCPPQNEPKPTQHCPSGYVLSRVPCRKHSAQSGFNYGRICYICLREKQPYSNH